MTQPNYTTFNIQFPKERACLYSQNNFGIISATSNVSTLNCIGLIPTLSLTLIDSFFV